MKFQPGQSGNPGGRPKGVGLSIRTKFGEDGAKLVAVLERYALGKVKRCSHRDRLHAIELLLERGWGKPAQVVAGDPENPIAMKVTFGGRYRPEASS